VRDGSDTIFTLPPPVDAPHGPGVEAERRQRETLQWIAGGAVGALVLLILG